MRNLISSRAVRAAMIVLVGGAAATACSAQDNASTHRAVQTFTAGQGGFVAIPDTTPPPASYALTGEQSPSQQAVSAWHREAGPVFSYGNSRILIPTR